jgi:hypothetical protein
MSAARFVAARAFVMPNTHHWRPDVAAVNIFRSLRNISGCDSLEKIQNERVIADCIF